MPVLYGQTLNTSLQGIQSYSNNPDRNQIIAFRLRLGVPWKISAISAGYISQGNLAQTSPYQRDQIQGRLTVIKNDFGLAADADRSALVTGYNPFQALIDFPNIGEIVFDSPVIDFYKETYDPDTLAFQPSDTVIVMMCTGYTAIDVSLTSYTAKVAYLNVMGGPLTRGDNSGNFRFELR